MFYLTRFIYGRWYWLCETGRSADPFEWGFREQAESFPSTVAQALASRYDASLEPA